MDTGVISDAPPQHAMWRGVSYGYTYTSCTYDVHHFLKNRSASVSFFRLTLSL